MYLLYIKASFIILYFRCLNCKQVVSCIKNLFQCTLKNEYVDTNQIHKKNCMACSIFIVTKSTDDN